MIQVHLAFTGMGMGDTVEYNADDACIGERGNLVVTSGGRVVAVFQQQTWLYYEVLDAATPSVSQ